MTVFFCLPAHGDMAAKSIGELVFGVFALAFALSCLGLVVLTVKLHQKLRLNSATAPQVFGAGAAGVGAVFFFALALGSFTATFDEIPDVLGYAFVLGVPALFAAQLFVSARAYRRLDAKGLALASTLAGAFFALVAAFFAFAVVVNLLQDPSKKVDPDVRRYRAGCEQGNASDCNMLGLRLQSTDVDGAREALKKSCDRGFTTACTNLRELDQKKQKE